MFQTFYREKSSPSKSSSNSSGNPGTANAKPAGNDFMPNFTTKDEHEEMAEEKALFPSQNNSSVISQWEKLPELRQDEAAFELLEDEPDESFSEMKPVMKLPETPVRKVIGQLKSELEEAKRPQTWAKAVKNEKSVGISESPPNCDNKENLQQAIPKPEKSEKSEKSDEISDLKSETNENPVWILPPPDEPKKRKKKKKAKKED